MKKIAVLIVISVLIITAQAQENFKWDEVIEQKGTKDELFSKAKLVLAQIYNDSEHVSRNTDKDAGIILSKPKTKVLLSFGMSYVDYYFEYELTLMVKDGRYRVLIDNVNCTNAYSSDGSRIKWREGVPVSTTYPFPESKNNMKTYGLKAKKYFELMKPLRANLQNIFDRIKAEMQKESIINDEW